MAKSTTERRLTSSDVLPVWRISTARDLGPRSSLFGLDDNDGLLLSLILDIPDTLRKDPDMKSAHY